MLSCRVWSAPIKIRSVAAVIDRDNGLRCNGAMDSKVKRRMVCISSVTLYIAVDYVN